MSLALRSHAHSGAAATQRLRSSQNSLSRSRRRREVARQLPPGPIWLSPGASPYYLRLKPLTSMFSLPKGPGPPLIRRDAPVEQIVAIQKVLQRASGPYIRLAAEFVGTLSVRNGLSVHSTYTIFLCAMLDLPLPPLPVSLASTGHLVLPRCTSSFFT